MANERKTYHLAPTRHAPPKGPIVLGSIIEKAHWPEETKLNGENVPIPPALGPWTSTVKDWSTKTGKSYENSGGLFAEFMQLVGLEITLGGGFKHVDENELRATTLETRSFNPSQKYLQDAMDHSVRKVARKRNWYGTGTPVYMITGVKIARGASAVTKKLRELNLHVQVTVNLAPVTGGVSDNVGPSAEAKNSKEYTVTATAMDDFVYAYRLTRITIDKDGEPHGTPHIRGAALDDREKAEEEIVYKYTATEADADADFDCDPKDLVDEHGDEIIFARKRGKQTA